MLRHPFGQKSVGCKKRVFCSNGDDIFVLFRWLYPEWICLSNYAFKIIRFSTHYISVVDELWTTKETTDMECWLPKVFGIVHYHTVQRIWTVIEVWHSQFKPAKICKFCEVNVDCKLIAEILSEFACSNYIKLRKFPKQNAHIWVQNCFGHFILANSFGPIFQ